MQKKIYALYARISRIYWALPLSENVKERIRFFFKATLLFFQRMSKASSSDKHYERNYIKQILTIPHRVKHPEYVDLKSNAPIIHEQTSPKLIAYYLPQFHPTPENDLWWGRGITEWNNVTRSIPQYVGHTQPRLVGELGHYDLRLKQNIARQIELAMQYGIYGFSFYYYWFDGKRLLDAPLNLFLKNKELDFPFMLCWANESWSKRFWGTDDGILIKQSNTEESNTAFISSVIDYFRDERYIKIDSRPVLTIYKPSSISNIQQVINNWRVFCRKEGIGEIFLIGVKEVYASEIDLLQVGFDAQTEFQVTSIIPYLRNITSKMSFINHFSGSVFDYEDLVLKKRYFESEHPNLYRAISPMWDNTPRRNNKGCIFHGSTPALYQQWLRDIVNETKQLFEPDRRFVFINAWNEWGEGAYLEPDAYHGYSYLEATRQVILGS